MDLCNQAKLEIQKQEEIIQKMDKNLDKMDRNLKKSEFIVRGMSSTFGFIKNIFSSNK